MASKEKTLIKKLLETFPKLTWYRWQRVKGSSGKYFDLAKGCRNKVFVFGCYAYLPGTSLKLFLRRSHIADFDHPKFSPSQQFWWYDLEIVDLLAQEGKFGKRILLQLDYSKFSLSCDFVELRKLFNSAYRIARDNEPQKTQARQIIDQLIVHLDKI